MLSKLRITNFKPWEDSGEIPLAPLTLIFGANSIGKSSLGHLLTALQQTLASSDRKQAFRFGDEESTVDLGTYHDCVFHHDTNLNIGFSLGWNLEKPLTVKDIPNQTSDKTETIEIIQGNSLEISVDLACRRDGQQAYVETLKYDLRNNESVACTVEYKHANSRHEWAGTEGVKLYRNVGRQWPADAPEKFYRMSDQSRARFQNAGFIQDFAYSLEETFSKFFYLGPLRESPKRTYRWAGDTPDGVGVRGENTVSALLAAIDSKRTLNEGRKKTTKNFSELISKQLQDMGMLSDISIQRISEDHKDYEVEVQTNRTGVGVKLPDIGFGVSQSLPPVVQAFYCPPNSTIWMEQPEIHLHPQAQAELADVFIRAVNSYEKGKPRNVQLIIESHSEHFLQRLQRRVAEEKISTEMVAIYFCRRRSNKVVLEPLVLDLFGNIQDWPKNFFGDEWADVKGRVVAEIKRRESLEADNHE